MENKLIFKGEHNSAFFLWVTEKNLTAKINSDCNTNKISYSYEKDYENKFISYEEEIKFDNVGVYYFCVLAGNRAEITINYDKGIYPFLVNGPGIMPTENSIGAFWLPKGTYNIYAAVPKEIDIFSISYNSKRIEDIKVYDTQSKVQDAVWEPELSHCPYHVNDFYVKNKAGYWRIEFNNIENDFKFNENNGLAFFLEKPDKEFLYNYFTPHNEQKLDYRVIVRRNGHIDAVFDTLYNEQVTYPVVPGYVEFVCTAGFTYKDKSIFMLTNKENELEIKLKKILDIPKGWIRGDLHVHSCYEDACSTPQRITKSGRCNGLDFMFLTDHGGKRIIDNGLYTWREKERFLPLPGQECVNERTHMNFLNVPFNIDYKDKTEGDWIEDAKNKNPIGNEYIRMLNHPSHLPEAVKGWWCTHFRSWWVATEHKEIELVENFDFRTWFDHLTRGRHLTGIWTTDSHDGTIDTPGHNCSFLYTDGELSDKAIINALKKGRVTNSFYLGAFLNMTVDGKIIGETVQTKEKTVKIKIDAASNTYIDRIELIANGIMIKKWSCEDSLEFSGEFLLDFDDVLVKGKKKWVVAVMYHKEHQHSKGGLRTQFTVDKVSAFTNPIYIEN